MEGEKNSRKSKERNKCRKIIIGLKELKIKIKKKKKKRKKNQKKKRKKERKKGKLHRTAKAQCRGRGL